MTNTTTNAGRESVREKVALIIDPPAFSEKYAPTLPADHERWLKNKYRRMLKAVSKADGWILFHHEAPAEAGSRGLVDRRVRAVGVGLSLGLRHV